MTEEKINLLVESALSARNNAYVPYSKFAVGAAVLTSSGNVYKGCNIENAAYSPTNCAERSALFSAISNSERDFCALAVVGAPLGASKSDLCPPCGVCRQVLAEFCKADFPVILARLDGSYKMLTLSELLPFAFTKDDL